jgi:Ser/Thr protein kinase RdoA (MazF antagonist)
MPALADMLANEVEERSFYLKAAAAIQEAYRRMEGSALPKGHVHGDFQFANVMRCSDGIIAMLDFDTCGQGYLAEDIFTFVWRSDMEIRDEAVNAAFIAGYERVRPMSAAERAAMPVFRAARDLVMCTTYAILINRVGPVAGFDGPFSDFTVLARRHLAAAGLA